MVGYVLTKLHGCKVAWLHAEPTAGYRSLPGGFRRRRKKFMARGLFASKRLQSCQKALLVSEFLKVRRLLIGLGKDGGCGNGRQGGRHGRLSQGGIGRRIAVETLKLNDGHLVGVFDAGRIVGAAKRAAGFIALLLQECDLAVQATKNIHHLGKSAEIGLDVLGTSGFLYENLGDSRGGGLEADFGQLGGVVAAKMIDQLVLVEPILKNEILFEAPLEMAASGPTRDVALSHGKAAFVKGGDNVLVRDAVAEHPVDHVALDFGETSDAASTACLVGLDGSGQRSGVDDDGCQLMVDS